MSTWFSGFRAAAAVVLSIVGAIGYPAVQARFGFPASALWTLAFLAGVWLAFAIGAWAFGSRDGGNDA